jgi:hypothetical protein
MRGTTAWRIVAALALSVAEPACVIASEVHQPLGIRETGATGDAPRILPETLVARARQLFGLDMSDEMVRETTAYRCMIPAAPDANSSGVQGRWYCAPGWRAAAR